MGSTRSTEDEDLMLKISQKMGGLPPELQPVLKKLLGPMDQDDVRICENM